MTVGLIKMYYKHITFILVLLMVVSLNQINYIAKCAFMITIITYDNWIKIKHQYNSC